MTDLLAPSIYLCLLLLVAAWAFSTKHLGLWLIFLLAIMYRPETIRAMTLLEAIAQVETGGNDRAVGRNGEVSRYQILPSVWREYSTGWKYSNRSAADKVAQKHLDWISATFLSLAGRKPTNWDLAACWNGGLSAYSRVRFTPSAVPLSVKNYAARVCNLIESDKPKTK